MGNRSKLFAFLLSFLIGSECYGQGETAVSFLMIPSSVEGNGMGGIAASIVTDDAISNISNPAQAGMFSLGNSLSVSTYSPRTDWLPRFASGLSLDATALSAGMRIDRSLKLPVPISIGIGYSHVYFDMGMFNQTLPSGPTIVSSFHAYEKSDQLTFGIGIDYFVKVGLGYSYKWIDSRLAPFGTEQEAGLGTAKVPAHDFGAMLQIPVVDIISKIRRRPLEFNDMVSPLFNLTFGWAERNIGGGVKYGAATQSDPLPRQGVLGWNFEIGLRSKVNNRPWKFLTFTWAREAEDVLVDVRTFERVPTPGDTVYTNQYSYRSDLGSVEPWNNLVLGKWNGEIALQKGWEIQFAECLYFRGGSNTDVGYLVYKTHGASYHLNGFLKLLASLSIWNPQDGWGAYILNHFDLQYNSSEYTSNVNSAINGTKFSSINFVLK